jgi:hypothetical protein
MPADMAISMMYLLNHIQSDESYQKWMGMDCVANDFAYLWTYLSISLI